MSDKIPGIFPDSLPSQDRTVAGSLAGQEIKTRVSEVDASSIEFHSQTKDFSELSADDGLEQSDMTL